MTTQSSSATDKGRPMPDETPREKVARRLLGLAALEKLLAQEKAALRSEAGAVFSKAGQREPIDFPDGTRLGDVRVDKVKGGWRVTDAGALRAWVEENRPDLIVEQVTTVVHPEWVAWMLEEVRLRGEAGEFITSDGVVLPVPPGVSLVADSTKLVVTPDKGAPEAMRRTLGTTGTLLGLRELEA